MKKIMFNDKYGLTQAVLEGRKTMTRRIVPESLQETFSKCSQGVLVVPIEAIPENLSAEEFARNWCETRSIPKIMHGKQSGIQFIDILDMVIEHSRFKKGDVVAVAQNYEDAGWNPNTLQQTFVKEPTVFPDLDPISPLSGWIDLPLKYHKGWSNKMFVYAGLMPHHIRITNVRVERLRDISDEDCIKEGIMDVPFCQFSWEENGPLFGSPREAFAALIDKVSGKGTWGRNPWVFAYEFELVI